MRRLTLILAVGILVGACGNTTVDSSASTSTAGPSDDLARASATEVPSSPPSGPAEWSAVQGQLQGGTYVMRYADIGGSAAYPTLTFTFTVADGWDKVAIDGLLWGDSGARVGFAVPDAVYADPCDPDRGVTVQPVGPSVSELATALLNVRGWDGEFVDISDSFGYPALHVSLAAPTGPSCEGRNNEAPLLRTAGFPGFVDAGLDGATLDLWILSVEGTRVVIFARTPADASAAARQDVQAVLDSVRIEA